MIEEYKITYENECCKKAMEDFEFVKIEGFSEYPNCLRVWCKGCFAKNAKGEQNNSQQIRSNSVQEDEVGNPVKEIGTHKPSLSSSADNNNQEKLKGDVADCQLGRDDIMLSIPVASKGSIASDMEDKPLIGASNHNKENKE